MLPDNIVCFFKSGIFTAYNEFFKRSHECFHLNIHGHSGNTVIAVGNDTHKFAVGSSVVRYGNGGMTCFFP